MPERTPETVLEQVVKLLSKTVANGATPEEAAAAASKAQSLMFAYNLSTADVTERTKRGQIRITESAMPMGGADNWRGQHYWQRQLLDSVCKYNFTMVLDRVVEWNPKARQYVYGAAKIIGTPVNLQATEYLYAYLLREISRRAMATRREALNAGLAEIEQARGRALTARERAEYRAAHAQLDVPSSQIWERSFGDGAVGVITEKLRNQRLADESGVTAADAKLVVTLDREVEEEWYRRKYGKSKAEHEADVKREVERIRAETVAASADKAAETSGVVRRSTRKAKTRRYSSPRQERYDYRAEELGRAAAKELALRPAVEGDVTELKQLKGGR